MYSGYMLVLALSYFMSTLLLYCGIRNIIEKKNYTLSRKKYIFNVMKCLTV